MARVLDTFPQTYVEWAKYLDGQVWELVQGVDFNGTLQNTRCALFHAATRAGLLVRTRVTSTKSPLTIVIQAYDKANANPDD